MFPVNLKWIDDIYDKIELVCTRVDDKNLKERESSKYAEGLKNVGNNVKDFCSTLDPLKFVEQQLTNVGTKVEQLYAYVVPSSVDTMLTAVSNIFPEKDLDSTACKKSELNDCKEKNDDSMAEPVTSIEKTEEGVSTRKFDNSKLGQDYNSSEKDDYIDEDSAPVYDNLGIAEGHNPGFCSPGQTTDVEFKVWTTFELSDSKEDNDHLMAEPVPAEEMDGDVASCGKSEYSLFDLENSITQREQCIDEDWSPIWDDFGIGKGPSARLCSSDQIAEVEVKEETSADDKISHKKVQLDESCVVIDKNDWFTSQDPVDLESPKIKLPSPSTLKLALIRSHQQMTTTSKSSTSKEPSSVEKEQALSLPNNDTWESDWEII